MGLSARVTVVSAPPGSGKMVLLRSSIGEAGLAERAAWVPVGVARPRMIPRCLSSSRLSSGTGRARLHTVVSPEPGPNTKVY